MANYEQELASFKQQWNLPSYDLDKLAANVYGLRFADSFLTGSSVDNSLEGQFVKWFSRTLSIYFETNTTPKEDGKYMSSFNAQAFYDSFKKLVQAKYDSNVTDGQTPIQVGKLAGAKENEIKAAIANSKRSYKKTLPSLWQENLKGGYLKLDTLKNITDNAYTALGNRGAATEEGLDGKLTNLIAAREAMKQLRESRSGVWGWLWKVIFNRAQNSKEKEYLAELNSKIEEFKNTYDVEGKVAALTGKTVLGKDVAVEVKEAENTMASPANNKNKIEPIREKISKKLETYHAVDLKNEWKAKLPSDINLGENTLTYAIGTPLMQNVRKLNQMFDQRIAENGDPKKEMERVVDGVFKLAVSLTSRHIVNKTELEKVGAIKVIAEVAVNALTAAAIYPNELGDVVKRCINENVDQYTTITRLGKDYLTEIENNRQKVFTSGSRFAEKSGNKSPQITQENKHSVPTLNNQHRN